MSNIEGVDDEMRQRSIETALKVEDQRTMQSYHIFKFLPEPEGGTQRTPYLLLELSN